MIKDITLISADSIYGQSSVNSLFWCMKNMEKIGLEFKSVKYLTSISNIVKQADKLKNSNIEVVQIKRMFQLNSYSDFCIKKLNSHFDTKFVLICQYDGFIIRPELWTDDFLEYDYIGAPWPNGSVGNGGFSLRSKKLCTGASDIANKNQYAPCHPEDVFLCDPQWAKKDLEDNYECKYAPLEIARRFSCECRKTNSFAFHNKSWLPECAKYMKSQFGELTLEVIEKCPLKLI